MNHLTDLQHDTPRGIVTTPRGVVLQIKEHNGWNYVNYNGAKIGLSKIPVLQPEIKSEDPILDYVLKGLYVTHPCAAMEYFYYRWNVGHKIKAKDYAIKFNVKHKQWKN
jgi:hypothetical protein